GRAGGGGRGGWCGGVRSGLGGGGEGGGGRRAERLERARRQANQARSAAAGMGAQQAVGARRQPVVEQDQVGAEAGGDAQAAVATVRHGGGIAVRGQAPLHGGGEWGIGAGNQDQRLAMLTVAHRLRRRAASSPPAPWGGRRRGS